MFKNTYAVPSDGGPAQGGSVELRYLLFKRLFIIFSNTPALSTHVLVQLLTLPIYKDAPHWERNEEEK